MVVVVRVVVVVRRVVDGVAVVPRGGTVDRVRVGPVVVRLLLAGLARAGGRVGVGRSERVRRRGGVAAVVRVVVVRIAHGRQLRQRAPGGRNGQEPVEHEAQQGEAHDQPGEHRREAVPLGQRRRAVSRFLKQEHRRYHRSRLKFFMSTDSRCRKTAIMIASPTAASAAATAITKKTNTWPCTPA